ncbi:HD domain-containing phosphohydrolase [Sulfurimonas sp.]|uniref:nitrate- and nitrite sensing domain-containing protein n=1 Tax=Sulfurimonas sp. TaxID=2022749 RepID=UPI00260549B0|nr:HD domain-containing phosphohydrolase [Sulfurimonas sp.]
MIDSYKELKDFTVLKENTAKIQEISMLINSLQKERGYSSGFLASDGKNFKHKLLLQQKTTDFRNKNFKEIQRLSDLRGKINSFSIPASDAFNRYTLLINSLLKSYLFSTKNIKNSEIEQKFYSYTHLLYMKEALGKIRGSLNGIFSQKSQNHQLLITAIHAKGEYDLAKEKFLIFCEKNILQSFAHILKTQDYIWFTQIYSRYTQKPNAVISVNPQEWFQRTTAIIEALNSIEKQKFQSINHSITQHIHQAKIEFAINFLFLAALFIIITALGLMIKNNIVRNIQLLQQYKNAVDRSSIVSKTDKKGKITYVNDKFCAISGYMAEELLGKPHNIVRHKDMPKSAFKEMWETILDKKPWFGIVKNRKKDGEFYTVEVTINPILNEKGEIEEFIAIRNDITEIVKLSQEIEETQQDIILKMGEIGETRSQETGFHVKRVALYSQILAKHYGLAEKEIQYLTIASPMHDIGKVAIPDSILNKNGKLTQDEWSVMKTHAEIGYELFRNSERALLKTAAIIAYEHHEKYDGSGYPRNLNGEDIHIYGRITALADVFDALGSERCYKKAWEDKEIFTLIEDEKGKHFDPKLVDIFFEHLDEFLAVRDKYTEQSSFMKEN